MPSIPTWTAGEAIWKSGTTRTLRERSGSSIMPSNHPNQPKQPQNMILSRHVSRLLQNEKMSYPNPPLWWNLGWSISLAISPKKQTVQCLSHPSAATEPHHANPGWYHQQMPHLPRVRAARKLLLGPLPRVEKSSTVPGKQLLLLYNFHQLYH